MLPPAEIEEAIRIVFQHNGAMKNSELTVAVARILGFNRAGPDLKAVIDAVVKTSTNELAQQIEYA